jgi:hypothetical protein
MNRREPNRLTVIQEVEAAVVGLLCLTTPNVEDLAKADQ